MSGIPIVLGFDPNSQLHLDTRYQNNGVPYIDTSEVLSVLPLYKRALHLRVDIQGQDYRFDTDELDHLAKCEGSTNITSVDGSIIVTPITDGFDLSSSETRTISIGAGLQEGYGLFYTGYTVRKPYINSDGITQGYAIASEGWHPSNQSDWDNLIVKCSGLNVANPKLKQIGNISWTPRSGQPNDLDSFGFSAMGAGIRDGSLGTFRFKYEWNVWWIANALGSTSNLSQYTITNLADDLGKRNFGITSGFSIRLVKDNTTLTVQGQKGEYVGNDGKHYISILIGTKEWLTADLAETKFRDGSIIHVEPDQNIWVNLTVSSVCAWANDWRYITSGDKTFTADKNNILSFKGGTGISVSSNIVAPTPSALGKVEVVISALKSEGAPVVPSYTDDDARAAVSGQLELKEDKSNKVTYFAEVPSDDEYPSARLVKDELDNKQPVGNYLESFIEQDPTVPNHVKTISTQNISDWNNKVDKITGYGLSESNFSAEEKAKLTTLEASHFKGGFTSFTALTTAHPLGTAGDTATVDLGVGSDVVTYIWDISDGKWVQEKGTGTTETAASIKTKYESNADTNAFTNALKAKLDSITAVFTSTLKIAYDTASTWITTNGANVLSHLSRTDNPHSVTKVQVGLSSVDNTSDASKPVSTAQAAADTVSKSRANHTGTQSASTISDFNTAAQSAVVISGKEDSANKVISVSAASTDIQYPSAKLLYTQLGLKETSTNKDASSGYAGMTLFKYNFKNLLNTFTSFWVNSNTAVRTYTFPDKDGTVAMTGDLVGSSLQNRCCQIVTGRTGIVVGADKGSAFIPSEVNNSKLTKVECYLKTAGTTATTINIRKNGAVYVLSTVITIMANQTRSTGSTPTYVIDQTNNTGLTDDDFSVEIVTAGTNAAGLTVTLTFIKQ